jgi:hypothetical protein
MPTMKRCVVIENKKLLYFYNNTATKYGVVLVNNLNTDTSAFFPSLVLQVQGELGAPALSIMQIHPHECVCIKTLCKRTKNSSFFPNK